MVVYMFTQFYEELPELEQYFYDGFECFNNKDFAQAIEFFSEGYKAEGRQSLNSNKYLSFIGLCQVLTKDCSGLNLLRQIASDECYDGDIFCNLAIAEFVSKRRRRAFAAIAKGKSIDFEHRGLRVLFKMLNTRRKPAIPALNRNNPLNVYLGKLSYKLMSEDYKSCNEYLLSYAN